jgi:hypothetical protein
MRRLLTALIVFLLFAATSVAQTKNALELVPEDALGFIVVHDLRQFSDKVADLAKKVNAPAHVSLLELVQRQGFRKGLDEKGSALCIVLKGADEKALPTEVFALPVADYPSVQQELGVKSTEEIGEGEVSAPSQLLAGISDKEPADIKMPKVKVLVAKKDNFALLTATDNRDGLKHVLSARKSITAKVQQASPWLAEQDIAGVCTDHGVKFGLGMGLRTPAGGVGSSTPEQVAQMKATFAEVEKNVKLIAFGGGFDKEGNSRLQTRVYFEPNGSFARWMAKADVLEGKLLGRLPEERCLFAALARISPQMSFEGLVEMLFAEGLPADEAKKVTADTVRVLRRVSELSIGCYTAPANDNDLPSAPGLFGDTVILAKADDAPSLIKDVAGLCKNHVQAALAEAKDKVEIKTEEKQIGQRQALLITLSERSPKEKDAKPGRVPIVLTALDKQTVLAGWVPGGAEPETFLQRFAQPPAKSLATNAQFRKTASILSARQAALYFNLHALAAAFKSEIRMPDSPPVGFGLSAMPDGIEAQFVVPFDTLHAVFAALPERSKGKADGK